MKHLFYALTLFSSFTLIGCGHSNENNTNATTNAQQEPVASINTETSSNNNNQAISPDDSLVYSVVMFEYAPFKFKDEYGKDVGYDVDILEAISQEQGFKVNISEVPYEELFSSLNNGTYDLAMSGLLLRPDRQKTMAASQPYSRSQPGFLVREESATQTVDDIAKARVADIKNGPLQKMLLDNRVNVGQFVFADTMFLMFQTIFTQKADAVAGMEAVLLYHSDLFSEHSVRFIPFADELYTTVYSNKNNQDLIDNINQGLEKIKANGKYQKINEKWFGTHAKDVMVN